MIDTAWTVLSLVLLVLFLPTVVLVTVGPLVALLSLLLMGLRSLVRALLWLAR
jgi:hypothetical protein